MSKPSAPKKFMPAGWIVAVVVAAAAAVVAAGPAKSGWHGGNNAVAAVTPNLSAPNHSTSSYPGLSLRTVTPAARARIHASYAALPLAFEANEGRTDPQVRYIARGDGYRLFLTSKQAILALPARKGTSEVGDMMFDKRRGAAGVKAMLKKRAANGARTPSRASSVSVLRMNLLSANPDPQLSAEDVQQGKVNYIVGKDPSKWQTNVPLYGRVNYHNVYPGVDLAFHGVSKQLEFDYRVSPGADAAPIALSFQGAQSIHTSEAGDLLLNTTAGPVRLHKPVAYQLKSGARETVDARFVLRGKNQVAFELGAYDHNRELVIDPTVTYSTYFGGDFADYGISIAVDAGGNSYIAGATDSDTIPASVAQGGTVAPDNNGTFSGAFDTFVTKIDASGLCVFTTFFGGSGDDFPGGIAIDSQGIYIAGTTDSNDFPATVGQTTFLGGPPLNGDNDAYAVKLGLTGTFSWGTYIAGSDSDSGLAVAVDSSHNVYVVGETFSNDLGGATGGVNPLPGESAVNLGLQTGRDDGYIVKLNSGGSAYSLVSYLGGSDGDLATGVALDGSGNIYVSGETISNDLPVTSGVVQGQCGTDGNCNATSSNVFDDAFVVSIKANLSNFNYVTYYGGSDVDDALAIAADASGNAFITGATASSDFPTGGTPFQSALAGAQNAFVVELNSSGTVATYGTYFGGDGSDIGLSLTLDGSDNVYLTGQTSSSGFPTVNATQPTLSGNSDAFVSVLGLSQGQVLFSTYLGGGGNEDQYEGAVGLDSSQNIYVTGDTDSGNGATAKFPTTAGAIDGAYAGGTCVSGSTNVPCTDAFVTAYGPATAPDFTISATTPTAVNPGSPGTSTVTLTSLNGYALGVNLTCSVSGGGSPAPGCSASSFSPNPQTPSAGGAASTLTITTTGTTAELYRRSNIFYAMWLPIVGLSLVGMRFSTTDSRRKKLLGFLLLGLVMAMLFFLPACSSGSGGGGGGGCPGCTPAGGYTVTITGTDANNLSHATQVTLTVN